MMPLPPATWKRQGFAALLGFAWGKGFVRFMMTPLFAATFCGQATVFADSLKHGSMIVLPIMQRNASKRDEAMELVQQ